MSVTFSPAGAIEPSLDVSNGNAGIVFALMGVEPSWAGHLPLNVVPGVIDRLRTVDCSALTRDTVVYGIVTHWGADEAQVRRYRDTLVTMLLHCLDYRYDLRWS